MKFQLFTQVKIREDIPEYGLKKGSTGTIVEYYPMPKGKESGYSLEGLIPEDTVEVCESKIEPASASGRNLYFWKEYRKFNFSYILKLLYFGEKVIRYKLWISTALTTISTCLYFIIVVYDIRYALPLPMDVIAGACLVLFALSLAWFLPELYSAREKTFERFYSVSENDMRRYQKKYQYLRYLLFKEEVEKHLSLTKSNINETLISVEKLLQTEPENSRFSGPLSILISFSFGIIGGTVASWPSPLTIVLIILVFTFVFYACMLLILFPPYRSRLLEFKRFMYWLLEDLNV
jgi:hypothetical protein